MKRARHVRLEELLGKRVVAADGTSVGRLEEVRVERRGDDYEVSEYLVGTGALFERLAFVRRLLGREVRAIVVRWDQLDITGHKHLRLLCTVAELKTERPRAR